SGLFYKAIWEGFDVMPEIGKGIRETLNHVYQKEGLQPLLDELQATDLTYFNQVDQQNWQRVIRALEVIRSSGKPFSSFRIQNKSQNRNFRNFKIGLELERSVLFERIDLRMDDMITNGLFEEAEKFYPLRSLNPLQTVGYTEVFNYLDGKYDKQEAIRLLKRNSRRYAKRQMTWFKKDPHIIWHSPNDLQLVIESIEKELQN
ncbi:MAG: tRNA dimethylallyltransferase, partial [Cyclobacteriaceae bacterium]